MDKQTSSIDVIKNKIIAEAKEASDSAEQCRQEHYELYCSRVRSMEENSTWSYIIFSVFRIRIIGFYCPHH